MLAEFSKVPHENDHRLSGKISWWVLSWYFPEKHIFLPLSSLLYSLLKTNPQRVYWCHCKFLKRGKSPLDVWWARWPPYISHSLHRQRVWKSVILLSSAVQMETTLSIIHHLHSTTCNAERLLSPPRSPHLCSFKGCRGCIQTAGYTLS